MDTTNDGQSEALAYIAGLFDGEGFTSFRSSGLQVGFQMGDIEPLSAVVGVFGGKIRNTTFRLSYNHEVYEVKYGGRKAITFLRRLLPYLKGKSQRVQLILQYYKDWYILSTAGRKGLVERYDQEPIVIRYRKYKVTGRPKGKKTIARHGVIKNGYGGEVTPFLLGKGISG